ncbi:GIY-YIG nuclease family protein [Shinella sp. PSBB067]|uniref:GIY-YIG nuclease family protein n=1 Tax=Shinella sp. PSBB067 TaxID=2715959 RepID=UPI00193BE5BD|nr:GIY-YIG nuclease family protein [Shinella sp. PSBB067]QRI65157.1 GIY-YIG nuclease family protein [Shinella sp. PSBB067]
MSGFVYMMSDKPRGVIYTGATSDLQGRAWEHRNEVQKGFTERYKAKNLVWLETHPNIVLAIQREKSLKRYLREWKIKLIEELNPTWMDLYEHIDEIENAYRPHANSRQVEDYN